MALAERRAMATWEGNLTEGRGRFSVESGAFAEQQVTWAARTTDQTGGMTSPEELIAAALASCFSMALSGDLSRAGNTPESVSATAVSTFDRVDGKPTLTKIDLTVKGKVPGIDSAAFQVAAEGTANGCPVSRALKGNVQINVNSSLESGGNASASSAADRDSSATKGGDSSGTTQPAPKPSQAEGDRATIEADIRQKEQLGKI